MIRKLALWLLAYTARKTHDVRLQLLCATLHGSLTLYGIGGTVSLVMKARKLSNPKQVVKRGNK